MTCFSLSLNELNRHQDVLWLHLINMIVIVGSGYEIFFLTVQLQLAHTSMQTIYAHSLDIEKTCMPIGTHLIIALATLTLYSRYVIHSPTHKPLINLPLYD